MDCDDVAKLKEKWYCTECELKQTVSFFFFFFLNLYMSWLSLKGKQKVMKPPTGIRGIFENLAHDISMKNPKAYRLPNDIIHFFKGGKVDTLHSIL